MTEIPEHLLKRAQAARDKAKASGGGGDAGAAGGDAGAADDGEKIPARLLTGEAGPGGGGGTATATVARAAAPPAAGPAGTAAGHTQRLLTVVKAGSIQDVKATPTDKVHVWPHLLVGEFVASLFMTAFLLVFSTLVDAPLRALRNYNLTPNPSKAPWYFLGLQEL